MLTKCLGLIIVLIFLTSCSNNQTSSNVIGNFNVEKDLFLANFDLKTDVDDIHSIAGISTMLNDPRFAEVNYHAVAGTYGIQEGMYIPANELFYLAFGINWSDAHCNFDHALEEVTGLVTKTLANDGKIWIAEAGQSDFTAALLQTINIKYPLLNTLNRIVVVQHSDWNESSTDYDNLNFVKQNSSYTKIPDGNETGNGSPGLKTAESLNISNYIKDPKLLEIWKTASDIANKFNGKENRYNNSAIANGGLDFSDVSETCWIFGYKHVKDVKMFFKEFSSSISKAN